jgi:hypothetical protein
MRSTEDALAGSNAVKDAFSGCDPLKASFSAVHNQPDSLAIRMASTLLRAFSFATTVVR